MSETEIGFYELKEGARSFSITTENVILSENLKYHVENNISLSNSVFRLGSDGWMNLVNEIRGLYEKGQINLNENDEFIILTEAGRTGIYQGKSVPLDSPQRSSGPKKFHVYVNSEEKMLKVELLLKKLVSEILT